MRKKITIISICLIVIIIIITSLLFVFLIRKNNAKKALFSAIVEDDINTVSNIIEKYPTLVNEYNKSFLSPLNNLIGGFATPLLKAIQFHRTDIAKLLIAHGADVNAHRGLTCPLIEACSRGQFDLAWLLIENGADISVVSKIGGRGSFVIELARWSSLTKESQKFELFKYAVENNVSLENPTECSYEETTILGHAIWGNNILAADYLLKNGISDINEFVTADNKTALARSVQLAINYPLNHTYDICAFLIANGADKTIKDASGKTAYDYAVEAQDETLISLLSD